MLVMVMAAVPPVMFHLGKASVPTAPCPDFINNTGDTLYLPPPTAPIPCSTLDGTPSERRCPPMDPDTTARWRRLELADRRHEAARELERAYRARLAREGLVPRTSHERP